MHENSRWSFVAGRWSETGRRQRRLQSIVRTWTNLKTVSNRRQNLGGAKQERRPAAVRRRKADVENSLSFRAVRSCASSESVSRNLLFPIYSAVRDRSQVLLQICSEVFGRRPEANDQRLLQFVGDLTAGDPPVPIPNTAVKPRRADCTARESVWESRSSPA